MIVTSISTISSLGSPKPTNTYFTIPLHPGLSWRLNSTGKMLTDLIVISTHSPEPQKLSLLSLHPAMRGNINFLLLCYTIFLQDPLLIQ